MYDDDMFVFGLKLGDGSDEDPFQCGFTSKALLNNAKVRGPFHIDATYKIIKHSYPVILFGVSDLSRKFWPIAYGITSSEYKENYVHFLEELNREFVKHNLTINIEYIISDAAYPISNAIRKVYPNSERLMCWFHLKQAIRRKKNKLLGVRYKKTLNEINALQKNDRYTELPGNNNLLKNLYNFE